MASARRPNVVYSSDTWSKSRLPQRFTPLDSQVPQIASTFQDRSTQTGKLITRFLEGGSDGDEKGADPNTVMLLFAANLFEQKYKSVAILLLISLQLMVQ